MTELIQEMKKKGYNTFNEEDNEGKESKEDSVPNYNYLLNMNIRFFTKQKLEELESNLKTEKAKLTKLEKTSVRKLWEIDLDELDKNL